MITFTYGVDISFELPSEEDLQSAGGIEFSTDQSRIYIPYTAIQYQKETEGTTIYAYIQYRSYIKFTCCVGSQVPIVSYAAKNLASILPARAFK